MKAFINLGGFEERARFSTWVARIGINSALMLLRKKRTYIEVPIDHDASDTGQKLELQDPDESPEIRYEQYQAEELLRQAILRLPPKFREVVEMRHDRECSAPEIARALGISVPAAKSRLLRARTALRALLLRGKRLDGMKRRSTA